MALIPLTILPENRRLQVASGTTILKAAHAAGIDIIATCGGRGRCTSCRVKFVTGTIPPAAIMDELQLGDDLVREGYRLSCQCAVTEPVTVQVSPPLDERAFQILGADRRGQEPAKVTIDAGVVKQVVKVAPPREEHHQTSDLEELLAAIGRRPEDMPVEILKQLPSALRGGNGEVTVASFGRQLLGVEKGDTAALKFGLAVDIGTTSVVTTLIELESGEQLASVSSLNPQAVFGGDLMSRIAFCQFNPANLRKLQTRIINNLDPRLNLSDVKAVRAEIETMFNRFLDEEGAVITRVEPSLGTAAPGSRYQFERLGYFCVDPDSAPGKPVFNRTVALKDTWAKIEKRAGQ